MVDFKVEGFNEASGFFMNFSKEGKIDSLHIGPDDKYSSMEFSLPNRFQIKEIPGKNNKDITMRTSDKHTAKTGTLFSFSITQSTVTYDFWLKILKMCRLGGPFHITWAFPETTDMCITKSSFKQESGFAETPDPIYLDNDSEVQAMVGTWTIEFSEYNKGTPGNAGGSATSPTTVSPPLVVIPTKSEPNSFHYESKPNYGPNKRIISYNEYVALQSNEKYSEQSGESYWYIVPGAI